MGLQTATNPKTGERLALIGDQWQPILKSATNKEGAKAFLVGDKWHTSDAVDTPKSSVTVEVAPLVVIVTGTLGADRKIFP